MKYEEFVCNASIAIMAQLVGRSVATDGISNCLQMWDRPNDLATIAYRCALALGREVDCVDDE